MNHLVYIRFSVLGVWFSCAFFLTLDRAGGVCGWTIVVSDRGMDLLAHRPIQGIPALALRDMGSNILGVFLPTMGLSLVENARTVRFSVRRQDCL